MTNLIPLLKGISQIPAQLKKMGKAEWADRVLAVSEGAYNQIGENLKLKEEINNLKDQIRKKDDEIKTMKDISGFKQKLDFHDDCFWDEKGRQICSACLDKPIDPALVKMHTSGRNDGFVKCPVCNTTAWSKGDPDTGIAHGFDDSFNKFDVF